MACVFRGLKINVEIKYRIWKLRVHFLHSKQETEEGNWKWLNNLISQTHTHWYTFTVKAVPHKSSKIVSSAVWNKYSNARVFVKVFVIQTSINDNIYISIGNVVKVVCQNCYCEKKTCYCALFSVVHENSQTLQLDLKSG